MTNPVDPTQILADNQSAGDQKTPYRAQGPDYVCALCGQVIAAGAHVGGDYDGTGNLVGVYSDTDPGDDLSVSSTHSCGTLGVGNG